MARVLIIDDRPAVREALAGPIRRAGHDVRESSSRTDAVSALRVSPYEVVFVGSEERTPSRGSSVVSQIGATTAAIVVVTASGSVAEAVQAIKAGAHDYLQLPIAPDEVVRRVRAILDERRSAGVGAAALHRHVQAGPPSQRFIAADGNTQLLFEKTRRVAEVDCTVLITGESGTGKEVIASSIFEQSARRTGRFVPVNCGAIPDTLIESELFGYHKGAFTGATSDKPGLIEEADGGVLFLDEIGEMSPRFQTTLLRFLDSAELRRVGDTTLRRVNTRIVAATNRRLDREVQRGGFRHDLFYRLSVVSLHVAPLRERPADVPALAEYFLRRAATKFRKDVRSFSDEAMALLRRYDWPGNVRQLQNVVEGALVLTTGDVIRAESLPPTLKEPGCMSDGGPHADPDLATLAAVVERFGGNQTQAAAALGVSRTTLWRKLRRTQGVQIAIASRG